MRCSCMRYTERGSLNPFNVMRNQPRQPPSKYSRRPLNPQGTHEVLYSPTFIVLCVYVAFVAGVMDTETAMILEKASCQTDEQFVCDV
jgi:hypothetical protein